MALQTLKPRLSTAGRSNLPALTPRIGATPRIRGRAWMEQRERVLERHNYLCIRCKERGVLRIADEIDHRIPLEQGGSNDDTNLDPLCFEHHKAKTATDRGYTIRPRIGVDGYAIDD